MYTHPSTLIPTKVTCFGGPRHGQQFPTNTSRVLKTVVGRDEFGYRLERYSNGLPGQHFYAWIAHGWWVSGLEAKDYVAHGLELIRLLSQIGSCKPWETQTRINIPHNRIVLWAESNGIIDKWCSRYRVNNQAIKRIVTPQNLYQIHDKYLYIICLAGWDSDPEFVEVVKKYLFTYFPTYLTEDQFLSMLRSYI